MKTTTEASSELKSQNSIDQNNNSNYSEIKIKKSNIEKLEGSLFSIANDPDKGWFLTIGKHMITEPKKTQQEAIEELDNNKWDIIMKMIIIVVDSSIEVELEERLKIILKNYTENTKPGV